MQEILNDGEVNVLILAGDLDYAVNHIGVESLVLDLDWTSKEAFNEAKPHLWKFENLTALEVIEQFQDEGDKPG